MGKRETTFAHVTRQDLPSAVTTLHDSLLRKVQVSGSFPTFSISSFKQCISGWAGAVPGARGEGKDQARHLLALPRRGSPQVGPIGGSGRRRRWAGAPRAAP